VQADSLPCLIISVGTAAFAALQPPCSLLSACHRRCHPWGNTLLLHPPQHWQQWLLQRLG
jgi:hypothetical protein